MLAPVKPLVQAIPYLPFLQYAECFMHFDDLVLLDSCAQMDAEHGRYSFIAYDPFATLIDQPDFFNQFRQLADQYRLTTLSGYPPFQGGFAGFVSYDFARKIETLPCNAIDELNIPAVHLGLYDVVIGFDHHQQSCWIFSSGFPETDHTKRELRAQQRLDECMQLMQQPRNISVSHALVDSTMISSNFTHQEYLHAIRTIKEYILAGDVFEVNLSQRFRCSLPAALTAFELYQRLRHFNPAPFSGYANLAGATIISSSPERFLQLRNRQVEAKPIKGTQRRSQNPAEDAYLAAALKTSEKDRAENTMIVDLMRNDLSKVCEPSNVKVLQYCDLESFKNVHHLISRIQGQLESQYHAIDLLTAAFPGGSITGAPKVRAMQIIEELETVRRGPYCGSMGYIGFNGDMDLSILIRSYIIKNQTVTFNSGGAIVLDSDPESEYQETLVKAATLKKALTQTLHAEITS